MMKRVGLPLVFATAMMTVGCSQGYQFDLPPAQQEFGQQVTYDKRIDVLFVVDNSSSMGVYQDKLAQQVPVLIDSLLSLKLDLHLGVATTSMGGALPNGGQLIGSPTFLTDQTSNLKTELVNRIKQGQNGSDLERGLDSLMKVISPAYYNGHGAGFFREGALFAIIVLSNEDDKSSDFSTVAAFANKLDQFKGFYDDGTRRWSLNFVGVQSLSGSCASSDLTDYKEPGVRWMELADLSSGVKASICESNYSVAVSNLRARIAHILTDFRLKTKPDLATVKVTINGVEIPRSTVNGWDYIESINAIRFYGTAVPPADASISVDFKPAAAN